MRVSDFSFDLPSELIAQEPAGERTASRLMVVSRHSDAPAQHTSFAHLPEFLRSGDVLVLNRTRVVPARLLVTREDGAAFEVFFLHTVNAQRFRAWVKPMKKLRIGDTLSTPGGAHVRFVERDRGREALFDVEGDMAVEALLEAHGHVPLPPYIQRDDRSADRERYQTVFAREPGSVAAPTAGLHFDAALLERLRSSGVRVCDLWLHVGPGTFEPLFKEEVEANQLHAERFAIGAETLREVAAARTEGRRIVAVGTTATRVLETAARRGLLQEPRDYTGETDLFLYPGAEFHAVDALITNFHLPRSSLLMLVCAFMGMERTLAHYREATSAGYRFFSYGDAMLIV